MAEAPIVPLGTAVVQVETLPERGPVGDITPEALAAQHAAEAARAATEGARDVTLTAKNDTLAARDKAQEWAESPTEPGGPGTKSSKTWAGVAGGYAADAEAARDTSFFNAHVYLDVATGRAAVADGEQFIVRDGQRNVAFTRTSSTTQDYVTSYLTYEGSVNPEIWRIKQKRAETAKANGVYVVTNRLTSAMVVLRSATRNADGTITIPAGDYIMSAQFGAGLNLAPDSNNPAITFNLVVGVSDLSQGQVTLNAKANSTDYTTGGFALPGIVSSSLGDGVTKLALANSGPYSWIRWFIHNPTGSPLTIWPPIYTTNAVTYIPEFVTSRENYSVIKLPKFNKDWFQLPLGGSGRFSDAKRVTKAADSVNGSSGNAGTLRSPKQTLAQLGVLAAEAVVGIFRGHFSREVVPVYDAAFPKGIEVIDVGFGLELSPIFGDGLKDQAAAVWG